MSHSCNTLLLDSFLATHPEPGYDRRWGELSVWGCVLPCLVGTCFFLLTTLQEHCVREGKMALPYILVRGVPGSRGWVPLQGPSFISHSLRLTCSILSRILCLPLGLHPPLFSPLQVTPQGNFCLSSEPYHDCIFSQFSGSRYSPASAQIKGIVSGQWTEPEICNEPLVKQRHLLMHCLRGVVEALWALAFSCLTINCGC